MNGTVYDVCHHPVEGLLRVAVEWDDGIDRLTWWTIASEDVDIGDRVVCYNTDDQLVYPVAE